ncbi:MAG: hypothetical protein IAE80_11215, partial [Anaerolinea sp.]|nr:hypothetical protein [Anaerolinea sp.]
MTTLRYIVFMSVVSIIFLFGSSTIGSDAQGTTATYSSWRPDNSYIAIAQGNSVQVVDVTIGQTVWEQVGMLEQIAPPQWSPDGTRLAIGNGSVLEIWSGVESSQSARRDLTLQAASYMHSFVWNPQGNRIAVAHDALEVWDLPSATLLYRVYGHSNFIMEVSWRANGAQIATASVDRTVKIWDAATGVVTQTMTVMRDMNQPVSEIFVVPTSVTWVASDPLLVFGVADGTVRLWDIVALSAPEVRTTRFDESVMRAGNVRIASIDANDLGSEVVSGATDGTLAVWNLDSGELIQSYRTNLSLDSVSYSQYGGRLLISGGQPTLNESSIGEMVILDEALADGTVQIVVPDPTLERLQAIAALCDAPLTVTDAIPQVEQPAALTD